jgi:hypothetical protein
MKSLNGLELTAWIKGSRSDVLTFCTTLLEFKVISDNQIH